MRIEEKLLALVASASWDGGEGVVSTLLPMLQEVAPFDAGEVAVLRPIGFDRWTLTDDDSPVAAEDFLLHMSGADEPLRIDELSELERWPRTRDALKERGLRSLLALPLSPAGGPEGAVVLARRQGWAFVAVWLHVLTPLVSMTGLCLERAAALTALRKEVELLRTRGGG